MRLWWISGLIIEGFGGALGGLFGGRVVYYFVGALEPRVSNERRLLSCLQSSCFSVTCYPCEDLPRPVLPRLELGSERGM